MISKCTKFNSRVNIFNTICQVAVIYIAISSIYPPIRAIGGYNSICILMMLMWYISAFLIKPKYFFDLELNKFCILFFMIYTFIVPYIFGNYVIGNRYLSISQILFFYIVYKFNKDTDRYKNNINITKIVIPFILLTWIKTTNGLISNPYLSRSIKSEGTYSVNLWKMGIGGYEFIYFNLFLGIILFYLGFLEKEKLKFIQKLACKIGFILSLVIIVLSNYFTALMILIGACILLVFLHFINKKNWYKITMLFLTIIIFMLIGKQIMILTLEICTNIIPEGKTLDRLITLQYEITNGFTGSLRESRDGINTISIQSFLENPIFGIVINEIQSIGGYLVGFGQHSQILDTFALFGIGIGTLQLFIISTPFIYRVKLIYKNKDIALVMLISTLILFYTNTVTTSLGLILFMIFPVIFDRISEKDIMVSYEK